MAVIRISGPSAGLALERLTGRLPDARRAILARLQASAGDLLDEAMVLWLPGPATATGDDIAELHCHGGRAVVAAVLAALGKIPGLRAATAGEFTRRAFANGRIDLAEAEGLADLLTAETELQRRAAIAMAGGGFSEVVTGWRARVLGASAQIEALLDFADEDDLSVLPEEFGGELGKLRSELTDWLGRPRAETLRDGYRVVIAGPPNAGKSTLFNALIEDEAAITAPVAGTTRDVLTRPVALAGVPFVFVDTAGLRNESGDAIEAIGMARARGAVSDADLVLWLGPEGAGPTGSWEIDAQADRVDFPRKSHPRHRLSAVSGFGMQGLREDLVATARAGLPKPGMAALNARQHGLLTGARNALAQAEHLSDPLLAAEELRRARLSFDTLLGHTTTEDMLDTLFGRFCIGK
ncbi:MAG: tRNA uridine-5-carboxymethylaminomethyl(34) synthesis GTPase MnmE [Pseudomonadota bacterium]|nr:tRNA uridine-5-carboxymethylaminomethyl(34) synthesis GTPase MnmE [Pseudomonadota bacterium]